jgi:hypothetical protein
MVRAYVEVAADREPPYDAVAVEDDWGRAGDVMPVRPPVRVHQAIASRYREVGVGDEPVAQTQPLRELLALLVGIW